MADLEDWQVPGAYGPPAPDGAETPNGMDSAAGPKNPASEYGVASMGFSILGGILKGMASYQAGKANAAIDRSNAGLADYAAGDARIRGTIAAQVKLLQGAQLASKQKAAFAGAGVSVSSGSAVDVLASTGAISDFEARLAQNQAAREAWGYEKQAKNLREKANMDEATGQAGLTDSILGGIVGAASYKAKMMEIS